MLIGVFAQFIIFAYLDQKVSNLSLIKDALST